MRREDERSETLAQAAGLHVARRHSPHHRFVQRQIDDALTASLTGDRHWDLQRHPEEARLEEQGEMRMVAYYARFEPDAESDRFFTITFPDIEWGGSQGENEEDGRAMALDLLRTLIGEHMRKGEEIPRARSYRGSRYRLIALSALESAKVELYRAFLASGIRKTELAQRLGIAKTNVDRLFALNRKSRLDQIEAAFASLGKRLEIEVRDAA
jgi:antitoxin HicB